MRRWLGERGPGGGKRGWGLLGSTSSSNVRASLAAWRSRCCSDGGNYGCFVCVQTTLLCEPPSSVCKNNRYRCTAWKEMLEHPGSDAQLCSCPYFLEGRCWRALGTWLPVCSHQSLRRLVAAPPSQAGGILLMDVLLAWGPSVGSVSELHTSEAEGEAAPNTPWGSW